MTAPVVRWTHPEAWLMTELARRLVTSEAPLTISPTMDGDPDDIGVIIEVGKLPRGVRAATLAMRETAADALGHVWRATWFLALDDGAALAPGRAPIAVRAGQRVRARLRVEQRQIARALSGDGVEGAQLAGVCVPIVDASFHRFTKQSTAMGFAADGFGPYATPTEAEAAPWWEIDLGRAYFCSRVAIAIAAVPPGTAIEVRAYGYATPTGEPLPGSEVVATYRVDASGARGTIELADGAIARLIRVTVRAAPGERLVLAVLGCEVMACEVHAATLLESLQRAVVLFGDRILSDDATYAATWVRAGELAAALAARLEIAGEPRPVIAVGMANRYAWVLVELAVVMRGYVAVGIGVDDGDERVAQILARTKAVCLVGEAAVIARARAAGFGGWTIDVDRELDAVIAAGAGTAGALGPVAGRSEDDPFAILFTSGSTGVPKGAMRSYRAFFEVVASYEINHSPRHLSFQPVSHLSERMYLPAVLMWGGTIAFSRGGAHLMDELRAFEPTTLGAVPRLYESAHALYVRRLRAAVATGAGESRAAIEARCLAEVRAMFGTRLTAVSVGSAPVTAELFAFMRRLFADLWVSEGYGSTEVGSIAHDGRVMPNVDVKLVPVGGAVAAGIERGEIWVKSPHAITGYLGDGGDYRSPLDAEGYFATGDLGERDAEGRVRVVGRLRNTVKNAQGEFVSAERIEGALASDPLIDRIYVHVESGAPGIAAVVVLAGASEIAADVRAPDLAKLATALRARGRAGGLAPYELPRAVIVDAEPWTVANGLVTANGKLARAALAAKFGARLSALAAGTAEAAADDETADLADGDLLARVLRAARTVVGAAVDPHAPLGSGIGVDSLAAAEILSVLADDLGRDVPLQWWFEARTLADLADRLGRFAGGAAGATADEAARDRELPVAVVATAAPRPLTGARHILLTGATGFLGAHLVEALAARGIAATCLVRAPDEAAALARLRAALAKHRIPRAVIDRVGAGAAGHGSEGIDRVAAATATIGEDSRRASERSALSAAASSRAARFAVSVIAGDLADPGLAAALGPQIAARGIDAIVHAGAQVSWLASYHALRAPNVLGTLALVELAAARGLALHHVSTISVAPVGGSERDRLTFAHALAGTPYGLSKWVAEILVERAASAGLPVAIYRPAMIANHSERGIGNADDFVNRYLAGCRDLGRYVDRDDAILDLTPVDFVAAAIAALVAAPPPPATSTSAISTASTAPATATSAVTATSASATSATSATSASATSATSAAATSATSAISATSPPAPIYHLANTDQSPSFAALGRALAARGVAMAPVAYAEFRAALLADRTSRLRALAAFFPEQFSLGMGPFPCADTLAALAPTGVARPPTDAEPYLDVLARELRALRE